MFTFLPESVNFLGKRLPVRLEPEIIRNGRTYLVHVDLENGIVLVSAAVPPDDRPDYLRRGLTRALHQSGWTAVPDLGLIS